VLDTGEGKKGRGDAVRKDMGEGEKGGCCIAMHPPTPPLESQQKTCVFWTVCMVCDRELAEKKGRRRNTRGEKNPSQNAKSFLLLVLHRHATINALQAAPS